MIDLSHLTEEEQGMIMTVLRRDAELKKAEEERIRKLEKILNTRSQADSKLKYLTGEWFYEAKSRRHMDKIHGSEIIVASMKRKTSGLDGSFRAERSKAPSAPGSDIVPPPKPARCLEALQPQDMNDAEKENLNSAVRSPRTPRHNPFNRASLSVVEPPENNTDTSITRDQESSETEPLSPLKHHPPGEASQTSGGSVTSETSSGGFKPVPKKRTFLSRHSSTQTESNGTGSDPQVMLKAVVPAPRRRIQRGSSGSTNHSGLTNQDEMSPKTTVPASNHVSQTIQPSPTDETSQQPLCDGSQIFSNSSVNKERNLPSLTNDRPPTFVRGDAPQRSDERHERTPTEQVEANAVPLRSSIIQDSDRENSSSVGTAMRQGELSLPQSVMDAGPPVSYYLNFIDKSDHQTQKPNEKNMFKLSTQTTSPADEEEDSIAKVLDWFSRSTDSSVWLKTDDSRDATKTNSDENVEINKTRGDDSVQKDAVDFMSNRNKETLETKRSRLQRQTNEAKDPRATDRTGHKEVTETQERLLKDTRERMRSQEVKDNDDENQSPKISDLKSFWEKSSKGPKILISKSITPSDKGQHLTHLSAEKDEENVNKPHAVSDMPFVPLIHNGKGVYNKNGSNHEDERDQQFVISPQKEIGDIVHLNNNQVDLTHNSDHSRGSDTEILSVTRFSLQPKTVVQSSSESESITSVKPNPQLDSIFQSRETPLQEELPKTGPMSQIDTDVQSRDSPDSEKPYFSRSSPFVDRKQVGNDVPISPKAQLHRGSFDDIKRRNSEDKIMLSSMPPKNKESNKDRSNCSHSNRQGLPHQDSAERIKQLKSFWEQERNTGKPKPPGEGKVARGANLAKMNKRFTKSEYDLRTIGNDSDSYDENSERNLNLSILPLNQRGETSPSLGTSRAQFNTLREFWGEATSDTKGLFSTDKPKNTKRKDSLSAQLPSQELKSGDPDIHRLSSAVEKTRPAVIKSSLSPQSRSKSPHDRQTGSGSRTVNESKNNLSNYTTAESRRSSKDSGREEKSSKPQSSSGKETRSPKNRKDSFSNSSSRGNSLRRAASMFSLSVPDEKDQGQLEIDVSPVHSQSRKQRQSVEKAAMPRRSSEDSETLTLRARAFVPRDYRHYLGMMDTASALAPPVKGEGPDSKSRYEFDPSGPMRASTPVSSDERLSRKSNKTSQRPLWANYSSSDTGPESSVSSVSETRSTSRTSSNRENDDDSQNPVRRALRRAEARPKHLTKSMEDITASLSPRQDRRADPAADHRRTSDVSSIPLPSTSLSTDPDHLKKMSKSVPSFLQKEDAGKDSDSTCEDSYHRGRLMTGSSMTNLTSSSGLASVSSVCRRHMRML